MRKILFLFLDDLNYEKLNFEIKFVVFSITFAML